jgi:hypothetical protein
VPISRPRGDCSRSSTCSVNCSDARLTLRRSLAPLARTAPHQGRISTPRPGRSRRPRRSPHAVLKRSHPELVDQDYQRRFGDQRSPVGLRGHRDDKSRGCPSGIADGRARLLLDVWSTPPPRACMTRHVQERRVVVNDANADGRRRAPALEFASLAYSHGFRPSAERTPRQQGRRSSPRSHSASSSRSCRTSSLRRSTVCSPPEPSRHRVVIDRRRLTGKAVTIRPRCTRTFSPSSGALTDATRKLRRRTLQRRWVTLSLERNRARVSGRQGGGVLHHSRGFAPRPLQHRARCYATERCDERKSPGVVALAAPHFTASPRSADLGIASRLSLRYLTIAARSMWFQPAAAPSSITPPIEVAAGAARECHPATPPFPRLAIR